MIEKNNLDNKSVQNLVSLLLNNETINSIGRSVKPAYDTCRKVDLNTYVPHTLINTMYSYLKKGPSIAVESGYNTFKFMQYVSMFPISIITHIQINIHFGAKENKNKIEKHDK